MKYEIDIKNENVIMEEKQSEKTFKNQELIIIDESPNL